MSVPLLIVMFMPLDESSDSLLAALTKARIPTGNHEFIRQFLQNVGIAGLEAVVRDEKPYVLARRSDGLLDLRIFHGFTNGFTSADEIRRVAGPGAVCGLSTRAKGTWYVEHPITQVRPTGDRSKDVRRQGGFCSCGMQLSLTGVCGSCD